MGMNCQVGNKPLCIDLFCGLGGWAEGFLAEGYDVIGFDIERHDYGTGGYPGQLVIQDVLTLHGSQFKDAAVIVASPPCQRYSYMAMPWTRAKQLASEYRTGRRPIAELNELFNTCFRLQREASQAAGRHIPLVVENVKGAEPWVGRARAKYGSFYLWGDMPHWSPFQADLVKGRIVVQPANPRLKGSTNFHFYEKTGIPSPTFHGAAHETKLQLAAACKTVGHMNIRDGHAHTRHLTNQRESDGVKVHGNNLREVGFNVAASRTIDPASKPKGFRLSKEDQRQHRHFTRKAASAQIAKIPFPLARHIAHCFADTSQREAHTNETRRGVNLTLPQLSTGEVYD